MGHQRKTTFALSGMAGCVNKLKTMLLRVQRGHLLMLITSFTSPKGIASSFLLAMTYFSRQDNNLD
ncbi:MAG: hypothetical protein JWR38_4097 [Mucilaginibacter sp.]|nr:hypothetical protein [Mucilaginibacter sp.]